MHPVDVEYEYIYSGGLKYCSCGCPFILLAFCAFHKNKGALMLDENKLLYIYIYRLKVLLC